MNRNSRECYGKLEFLEGIRGIAALNVVVCHFVVVYFPQMYYESYANLGGRLSLVAKTPLSVLVNGDVAVRYFFILTGFLACRTAKIKAQATRYEIGLKALSRYTRLFPVVTLATAFTFLTMLLGLQSHLEISEKVINDTFLLNYCNFTPTLKTLFSNIFWKPYLTGSIYISPFWTIRYEFLGYIVCLLLCWFVYDSKWRRCIYLIGAVICYTQLGESYLALFMGVFIGDIWYSKDEIETILQKYYISVIDSSLFSLIITLIGLYLMCCPMYFVGIYKALENLFPTTALVRSIGIALVFYALLHNIKLRKFFENSVLKWLGKISFEIYAFHWPIMLTVQAGLFKYLILNISYKMAAVFSFILALPIIIAGSYLVWYLVEKKRLLNIYNFIYKNKVLR